MRCRANQTYIGVNSTGSAGEWQNHWLVPGTQRTGFGSPAQYSLIPVNTARDRPICPAPMQQLTNFRQH